ncbi:hypothetical protein M0E84_00465 [Corynebacterium sp. CCM 9186]|nr:hypothetical protein [Corynebacterium meridianum]MCK7676522.1 hypothetical protein [Corynebacterium meridianum]
MSSRTSTSERPVSTARTPRPPGSTVSATASTQARESAFLGAATDLDPLQFTYPGTAVGITGTPLAVEAYSTAETGFPSYVPLDTIQLSDGSVAQFRKGFSDKRFVVFNPELDTVSAVNDVDIAGIFLSVYDPRNRQVLLD